MSAFPGQCPATDPDGEHCARTVHDEAVPHSWEER